LATREPVARALAALSEEQRQVLLLFSYAELSANEVAEVLGITPEAARKRRQRAREHFEAAYRAAADEE
jgi:RNA polymerase sigma factor (sigma-70 family)